MKNVCVDKNKVLLHSNVIFARFGSNVFQGLEGT